MPSDDVTQILTGSLGHFWEWRGRPTDDVIETRGGYLDIDDGAVRVNTLIEDEDFDGRLVGAFGKAQASGEQESAFTGERGGVLQLTDVDPLHPVPQ